MWFLLLCGFFLFRIWDPLILALSVIFGALSFLLYFPARGISRWADVHPTTLEDKLSFDEQGLKVRPTRVHYTFPQIEGVFWVLCVVFALASLGSLIYGAWLNMKAKS